jgi:hypothetical protein
MELFDDFKAKLSKFSDFYVMNFHEVNRVLISHPSYKISSVVGLMVSAGIGIPQPSILWVCWTTLAVR